MGDGRSELTWQFFICWINSSGGMISLTKVGESADPNHNRSSSRRASFPFTRNSRENLGRRVNGSEHIHYCFIRRPLRWQTTGHLFKPSLISRTCECMLPCADNSTTSALHDARQESLRLIFKLHGSASHMCCLSVQ